MKPLLLLLFLAAVSAAVAQGQDFQVTERSPAAGQSSVALETTVAFTFSMPVDTTARFEGEGPLAFYTVSPADSITVDSMYVSEDRMTVSFDVTHRPDTDYTWILTGARSDQGDLLCKPAALSYTTNADPGDAVVKGDASIVIAVKRNETCSFFGESVIVLLNAPPGPEAAIVAATETTYGEFEITGVRAGTYWPVMFIDTAWDGLITPVWDLAGTGESEVWPYDPDNNDQGDSLVIEAGTTHEIFLGAYSGAKESTELPGTARLLQNYPNPFTGSTALRFELERPLQLEIAVYDIQGRRVARPAQGFFAAGLHEVPWDADALAPGAYFITLEGSDFTLVRQLIRY
jgi:hypothetical protein